MPDTGMFYLFEVCCSPEAVDGEAYSEIDFVRAECNSCQSIFKGTRPPRLEPIKGGGAVINCPGCGARQAVAGARFAEYMARFPSGNCDTHRAEASKSLPTLEEVLEALASPPTLDGLDHAS